MSLLKEETGWDTVRLINLLILIMVSSGVFGFVYELLFYKIDTGKWIKRGKKEEKGRILIGIDGEEEEKLIIFSQSCSPFCVKIL